MDYIIDRFGNVLSKNSVVAYVDEDGLIERGYVVEAVCTGRFSSHAVRIEPFKKHTQLVVKPTYNVMKIFLPNK